MQFRIAELQTFLETYGEQNLKLRKKELQKKALVVLSQKKSKTVERKIASLYKSMNSSRRSSDTQRALFSTKKRYNFNGSSSYDDDFYAADEFRDAHFSSYENSRPLDLSENSSYLSKFELLDREKFKNIKFPELPFFEHILDIMLVTPLVPISEIDTLFEFKTTFSLNDEAYNFLFPCDDKNSKYEVMLRLCLFNEKLEIEDSLPQKLYLSINNKFCPCTPDNYSSKKDPSGKRPATPINITPFIDRRAVLHQMIINWSVSYHMMFAATIQLVKKKNTDDLIRNLVEKGEQNPSVSKKFIYDNLNDEDNEIAATSLKMSLICPLGKMLMTYPTRGTTCNHLQCFDGALYIKMNEIKSTWQCPVCNQTCFYENLFIDGYFMDILRSDKIKPDVRDVQISEDGSWETVASETKKRPKTSSPEKVLEKRSRTEEKLLPEENSGMPEGSFVDDLKEIFSSFINCSETRSHYPEFSIYNGHFFEPPGSGPGTIPSSEPPAFPSCGEQQSSPAQKKVILVDLISDSDSSSDDDDVKSTSSSSGSSTILYIDRAENNPDLNRDRSQYSYDSSPNRRSPSSSPPVYDIDSD